MGNKRLKKSADKKLCGVCGGFGEYLDIDPTIVRIGFVFLSLCLGGGLLLYIISALFMPNE